MSKIADVIKNESVDTCEEFGIDIKSEIVLEESKIECVYIDNNVIKINDEIEEVDKQDEIAQLWIRKRRSTELFKCPQCNSYETYYKRNLSRHIKQHGERQKMNCTFCGKEFFNKRSLHGHIVKSHSSEKYEITSKVHTCELCKFQTIVREEMSRHMQKQHPQDINSMRLVSTNHDDDEFSMGTKHENGEEIKIEYDAANEEHVEISMKKNKRHNCNFCNYQTHFRRAIKEHMSIHNKDTAEQFKCHQCNFTTYYKMSLHSHLKRHGERKKFNCSFCLKEFYSKRVLHNHLLKYHPNEKYEITSKLHSCKICTFKTTVREEMKRHMRKHSQDIHPKHCVTLAYDCSCHKSVKIQFYKCFQCDYRTDHVSEFQKHLRTHSKYK